MKLKELDIGAYFVTMNEVSNATGPCFPYLTVYRKVSVHYSKNVLQKETNGRIPVCRAGMYFEEMEGDTEVMPCKI